MRSSIRVLIVGGDSWQRERLASEVVVLLESLKIDTTVDGNALMLVQDDEHHDQLQQISHTCTVRVTR